MSFISNINALNYSALLTARHNDTHSNDALRLLLVDIYTATPNAVIIDQGVNYRVTTNDFQAWALYYDADVIPNIYLPNRLELISQYAPVNNYAYVGNYEIFNETDLGGALPVGDYFCIKNVFYQNPGVIDVNAAPIPMDSMVTVINSIGGTNDILTGQNIININWNTSFGATFKTVFDAVHASGNLLSEYNSTQDCCVMLPAGGIIGGDAIPAYGTTGIFGITLTEYNI